MQIVLLKEPHGISDDPYEKAFEKAFESYCSVIFVPVLEHSLCNQADLLERGSQTSHSGLIVTSQRAVDALRVVQASYTRKPAWTTLSAFVVGPATKQALAALPYPPSSMLGSETGNAESLGRVLVEYFAATPPTLPLLYLTGDKRRDTITDMLNSNAIPYEELEVYQTRIRPDFAQNLAIALRETRPKQSLWIVFFSPSGVKAAMPILKRTDKLYRVAAIGPTTQDYLRLEYHTEADIVPCSPSATELAAAIAMATESEVGRES